MTFVDRLSICIEEDYQKSLITETAKDITVRAIKKGLISTPAEFYAFCKSMLYEEEINIQEFRQLEYYI